MKPRALSTYIDIEHGTYRDLIIHYFTAENLLVQSTSNFQTKTDIDLHSVGTYRYLMQTFILYKPFTKQSNVHTFIARGQQWERHHHRINLNANGVGSQI